MSKQTSKLNPPEDPGGSSMKSRDFFMSILARTKKPEQSEISKIPQPDIFPLPETQISFESESETLIPETCPLPESPNANSFTGFGNRNNSIEIHSDHEYQTTVASSLQETQESTQEIVNHYNFTRRRPLINPENLNFPTNSTMRSSGKENTIVFRQAPPSDGNNNDNILTQDPVSIALSFNSQFPQEEIKDIRINRRRNVVAVEVKNPTVELMNKLRGISKIGKYTVNGHAPSEEILGIHCSGVISPIALDANLDELRPIMSSLANILKLTRLSKFSNGRKEDSTAIKIDFEGCKIPDRVKLGYVSFHVKEYNPPPIRCFRCQRLGHMAGGCTATPRCQFCGGNHPRSECGNKDSPKCPNCGLGHTASSRQCIFTIKAIEINKLMRQGKTFTESKNIVDRKTTLPEMQNQSINNPNRHMQNNSETNFQHRTRPTTSYSEALRNNRETTRQNNNSPQQNNQEESIPDIPHPPPNFEEHTQQTRQSQCSCTHNQNNRAHTSDNITPKLKEVIQECLDEFCGNLVKLIKEIFTKVVTGDIQNQEKTIVNALKQHIGIELPETPEIQQEKTTRNTRSKKKNIDNNNNQQLPDINDVQMSSDTDSQATNKTDNEEEVLSSEVEIKTNCGRTKRKKHLKSAGKKQPKSDKTLKNKKKK